MGNGLTRRRLFALGAAATVAPLLPAVESEVTYTRVGTEGMEFAHLFVRPDWAILPGDKITINGDPRTFTVSETHDG